MPDRKNPIKLPEVVVTATRIDPKRHKKIYTDKASFDKASKAYSDSTKLSSMAGKAFSDAELPQMRRQFKEGKEGLTQLNGKAPEGKYIPPKVTMEKPNFVHTYEAPRETPVFVDAKKYREVKEKVKLYPSKDVDKYKIDSLKVRGHKIGDPIKQKGQVDMYGTSDSDKIKKLLK